MGNKDLKIRDIAWTELSLSCYKRGCKCEGCYYKDFFSDKTQCCHVHNVVNALIKRGDVPPLSVESIAKIRRVFWDDFRLERLKRLVKKGYSTTQIADAMSISYYAVNNKIDQLGLKKEVKNRPYVKSSKKRQQTVLREWEAHNQRTLLEG
jgi:DNA-binding CsgD family transcriptional regulator